KINVSYVLQEISNLPEGFEIPAERTKPWGTGHAVLVAANEIDMPFAVINADDFYGKHAFKALADYLSVMDVNTTDYCMVGYKLQNTLSDHGSVSRGICVTDNDDFLVSITERTKINKQNNAIAYEENNERIPLTGNEIASMNMMGFPPSVMQHYNSQFKHFLEKNILHPKAEFYIPTVVNNLINSSKARMKVLDTPEKWFGVTYRNDKEIAVQKIQSLVAAGAYPERLWV
ncbi:MAG: nucleotidyltransferase, partial [Bacteroidota bacterium]